jgi:hypothetical protein
METRYIEAGPKEYELLNDLIAEVFPELVNAKFKIFFNLKKHVSQTKIVLAHIEMTDDLTRYLTISEFDMAEGADYCIFLDHVLWTTLLVDRPDDKIRLMRHELRHTRVEPDSKRPYKISPHDIEDFVEEVKLNKDNPGWMSPIAQLLSAVYEQMKEDSKG